MAYSVTVLCWGIVENRAAYVNSGQLGYLLNDIKWETDYLIRCHAAPNVLYGQCGDGIPTIRTGGPASPMSRRCRNVLPRKLTARIRDRILRARRRPRSRRPQWSSCRRIPPMPTPALRTRSSSTRLPTSTAASTATQCPGRRVLPFQRVPRRTRVGRRMALQGHGDSSYLTKAETYYDSIPLRRGHGKICLDPLLGRRKLWLLGASVQTHRLAGVRSRLPSAGSITGPLA
jgi:hypothetical protein